MTDVCVCCVKKVEEDEKGIQCEENCDRWFHTTCVNITEEEYDHLMQSDLKWTCSRVDCVKGEKFVSTNQLMKKLDLLISKTDENISESKSNINKMSRKVLDKIEEVQKNMTLIGNKVSGLETRMTKVEAELEDIYVNNTVVEVNAVSEAMERIKRAKNLVLYHVPEGKSRNNDDNLKHDIGIIKDLFGKVSMDIEINDLRMFRIGRFSSDKVRPLKIILPSESSAMLLHKNINLLAKSTVNGNDSNSAVNYDNQNVARPITASRDRTLNERNYFKELKAQLEERINRGEKDISIKYVNSVQKIVKTKSKN